MEQIPSIAEQRERLLAQIAKLEEILDQDWDYDEMREFDSLCARLEHYRHLLVGLPPEPTTSDTF